MAFFLHSRNVWENRLGTCKQQVARKCKTQDTGHERKIVKMRAICCSKLSTVCSPTTVALTVTMLVGCFRVVRCILGFGSAKNAPTGVVQNANARSTKASKGRYSSEKQTTPILDQFAQVTNSVWPRGATLNGFSPNWVRWPKVHPIDGVTVTSVGT